MLSSTDQNPDRQILKIIDKTISIRNPPPLLELDPNFFDEGYTLAAQTSSSIWEGTHSFLRFIESSPKFVKVIQKQRCLELGSGTGVSGLALCVLGGDVILTDIKSVLTVAQGNIDDNFGGNMSKSLSFVANRAVVEPLDWTCNVEFNGTIYSTARIIIAVETCWLKELSNHFVETFSRLLQSNDSSIDLDVDSAFGDFAHDLIEFNNIKRSKFGIWVYKERGLEESECFTTLKGMTNLFYEYGCTVTLLEKYDSIEDLGKCINVFLVYQK